MGKDKTQGTSGNGARKKNELAEAAAAIDRDLARLEELAEGVGRVSLTTHKNLDQATEMTREAAATQQRFGEHLQGLIAALNGARDRQQTAIDTINARVDEIEARTQEFETLRLRFAGLGEASRTLNALVQQVATLKKAATTPEDNAQVVAQLESVQGKMDEVVNAAQEIAQEAHDKQMVDLARQADSMRQQILAARNKLKLLEQALRAG